MAEEIRFHFHVAQNFGNTVALEKLDEIEESILRLGDDSYNVIGVAPLLTLKSYYKG